MVVRRFFAMIKYYLKWLFIPIIILCLFLVAYFDKGILGLIAGLLALIIIISGMIYSAKNS